VLRACLGEWAGTQPPNPSSKVATNACSARSVLLQSASSPRSTTSQSSAALDTPLIQARNEYFVVESTNPKIDGWDGAVMSFVEYLYELGK